MSCQWLSLLPAWGSRCERSACGFNCSTGLHGYGFLTLWTLILLKTQTQINSCTHCLDHAVLSWQQKVTSTKFQDSNALPSPVFLGIIFKHFKDFFLKKHVFSKTLLPILLFLFLLELSCILFASYPSGCKISSPGIGLLRGHGKLHSLGNYFFGRIRFRQTGYVWPRAGHFGIETGESYAFGD